MKGLKVIIGSVVALLSCTVARAQAPVPTDLANVYKVDFVLAQPGMEPRQAAAIVREGANSAIEIKPEGSKSNTVKVEFSVVEDPEHSVQTGQKIAQLATKVSKKDGDKWDLVGQPEFFLIVGAKQPSRMAVGDRYDLTASVSKVAPENLQTACAAMTGKKATEFDLQTMFSRLAEPARMNPEPAGAVSPANQACCCCTATCPRDPANSIWCCNVICCSEGTACGASCCTRCGGSCT